VKNRNGSREIAAYNRGRVAVKGSWKAGEKISERDLSSLLSRQNAMIIKAG
jgi:hypothetical protein